METRLMRQGWILLRAVAAAAVVGGCVNQLALRQSELTHWIGRPEVELIGAMGAPNRSYDSGGVKFLTYEERRTEIIPGTPYGFGPSPFMYGGYGGGFPPTATTLVCDTTFTIGGGLVRAFSLRGNACG
jgi:hypothetical protein